MTEKNLIKIYVDASSAKRVDIIIKHYTDFMGINYSVERDSDRLYIVSAFKK